MCFLKLLSLLKSCCLVFVSNKSNLIDFVTFYLFNHITNYIEKRTITLPNAISNVIDFNYFSIAQKALHISGVGFLKILLVFF